MIDLPGFKTWQVYQMNILIRLPNWLGDMVMSTAFIKAVGTMYPYATIDVITKNGIDVLLDHMQPQGQRYVFSKKEYKGLGGAWQFGKTIRKQKKYDLFFCLPNSFSSALMGLATGAKKRVGYKKELRSILLTSSYTRKKNLHRAEEYIDLLQQFIKKEMPHMPVGLTTATTKKRNAVVININSEASSRRLPKEKAVSIISAVRKAIGEEIILVGTMAEKEFVDSVFNALPDRTNITNTAGDTNLTQLIDVLGTSRILLSTDSGPAHVANALGTFTIVLFGAGNEKSTAPYNVNSRSIIRLGQLPCEPCTNNTCKVYGVPECLLRLDEQVIVHEIIEALKNN